jgi:hypothetical protein
LGEQLSPLAVLRSRDIKEFRQEIVIVKNFGELKIEAGIERKDAQSICIFISLSDKSSARPREDLRLSLFRKDTELESYVSKSGRVSFSPLVPGRYTIKISSVKGQIARIALQIKPSTGAENGPNSSSRIE